MIKITTEEDFKQYRATDGYFIVKDNANKNKVHVTRCPTLDISTFREKVLSNDGKNGEYLYTDDLIAATNYTKGRKCENCRRIM